jgi:hypothetical protein
MRVLLIVFEKRVLRRIFGTKAEITEAVVTGLGSS